MREESLSREIRYGKQDIAELESASIQVHLIYQKTAELFKRSVDSRLDSDNTIHTDAYWMNSAGSGSSPAVLQNGFKRLEAGNASAVNCGYQIVYLMQNISLTTTGFVTEAGNGKLVQIEMLIQAVVWSQYEKSGCSHLGLAMSRSIQPMNWKLLRDILCQRISRIARCMSRGKVFKIHQPYGHIPLYQEYVDAPSCCVQVDGALLEGRLLTGVLYQILKHLTLIPM